MNERPMGVPPEPRRHVEFQAPSPLARCAVCGWHLIAPAELTEVPGPGFDLGFLVGAPRLWIWVSSCSWCGQTVVWL